MLSPLSIVDFAHVDYVQLTVPVKSRLSSCSIDHIWLAGRIAAVKASGLPYAEVVAEIIAPEEHTVRLNPIVHLPPLLAG